MSRFTARTSEVELYLRTCAEKCPDLPAPTRSDARLVLETWLFEKVLFGFTLNDPRTGEPRCPRKMPPATPKRSFTRFTRRF